MVSKKIKALGILGGAIAILGCGIVSAELFYQDVLLPFVEPASSVYMQSVEPIDINKSNSAIPDYRIGPSFDELVDEKNEEMTDGEKTKIINLENVINETVISEAEQPAETSVQTETPYSAETPVPTETPVLTVTPVPTETPATDQILMEWQGSASEPVEAAYALLARGWKYYPGDWEPFGVEDYFPSVKNSLIYNKGDCEDAILNIAAAVEDDGYAPLMLGIYAEPENSYLNHIVYPYQNEEGKWGMVHIVKSDGLSVVRYITPRFDSVKEMVEHFIIYTGKPYKYYALIDLKKVEQRMDWRTSDDTIELLMSDIIEHTIPEDYSDS